MPRDDLAAINRGFFFRNLTNSQNPDNERRYPQNRGGKGKESKRQG
jgi:hypothetical protein